MPPPSVDALARSLTDVGLPPPLLVDAAREAIAAGAPDSAQARAVAIRRPLLGRVVNATGVLLHTNLGRAPYGTHQDAAYANLELDVETGRRAPARPPGRLFARLCDAERHGRATTPPPCCSCWRPGRRARWRCRGESVEIGGASGARGDGPVGARLVDVGTTNRTRVADYGAPSPGPAPTWPSC